jgi:hypothetical protein
MKKSLTARNWNIDELVKEAAYDLVFNFISDFENHFYSSVNDNIYQVLPYTDLVKAYTNDANVRVSEAKTGMREDSSTIVNMFRIDDTLIGVTTGYTENAFDYLDGTKTVQAKMSKSNTTEVVTCDMEIIERVDGCQYGPLDDLKYKALCELGGGSFTYGSQTYDCSPSSYPSAVFCDAATVVFL